MLEQTKPILIDSIPRTLYNIDPITDVNFEQYSIEEIIHNYNKRSGKCFYFINSNFRAGDFQVSKYGLANGLQFLNKPELAHPRALKLRD